MKEKTFQTLTIIMLGVILLVVFIGFTVKRNKSEYGSSVNFLGKPVLKNKELKQNLTNADAEKKRQIALAHNLKVA